MLTPEEVEGNWSWNDASARMFACRSRFQVHPPKQVVEARVVAEGVPSQGASY